MASTRAGQFKGKLSYMAPEQASSSETDQRSDLFSVGIILWESLTGRRLFKGESNAATLNKLLNDTVVKPSELWPELERFDAVVMKALSRDPDQRFQSADEFADALEGAVGSGRVAKTREVADVVRDLDAEKLQDERDRVRDAIKMLGSTDIGTSIVPMPREGTPVEAQTFAAHGGTGSHVHGTVSGVLSDGTPVVVRRASDSDALKWFVMALAIIVFMYAGFLVFKLLRPPSAPGPALGRGTPAAVEPPAAPAEPDSASAGFKARRSRENEARSTAVDCERGPVARGQARTGTREQDCAGSPRRTSAFGGPPDSPKPGSKARKPCEVGGC